MPPQTILLTLKESRQEYRDVWTFLFSASERPTFHAGQYGHVRLPGIEGKSVREFSFASAPGDEQVQFTVRIRPESPYKKRLGELVSGDTAELFKIKGDFVLPDDQAIPLIFVAQGIGITPVRSMLRFLDAHRRSGPVTLVHIDRGPFLFETELSQMPLEQHRVGRIGLDEELASAADRFPGALFYVVGSPVFVSTVDGKLKASGIPAEQIKTDDWEYEDAIA